MDLDEPGRDWLMPADIWYVYGIVPATIDARRAPEGLDEARVETCVEGDLAALASRVDGERYAPATIERATEDVEWLAPRAVAHDRVLTWASDQGAVIPLPIFSLFSTEAAVLRMLRERSDEIREALGRTAQGREYSLRVYRIDAELVKVATELSPRLAELQSGAQAASPGQRYLLERKLDGERRNELHAIGARVAGEVVDTLRPFSLETAEGRIAARANRSTADAQLILDAAFLVAPSKLEAFQRSLTELVKQHAGRGFRFDFTGPWPPYHFVRGEGATARHDA